MKPKTAYRSTELGIFAIWFVALLLDGSDVVSIASASLAQMGLVAMVYLGGRSYVKTTDPNPKPGKHSSEFIIVIAWQLAVIADGSPWFSIAPDSLAMLGHAAMVYSGARSWVKGKTAKEKPDATS